MKKMRQYPIESIAFSLLGLAIVLGAVGEEKLGAAALLLMLPFFAIAIWRVAFNVARMPPSSPSGVMFFALIAMMTTVFAIWIGYLLWTEYLV